MYIRRMEKGAVVGTSFFNSGSEKPEREFAELADALAFLEQGMRERYGVAEIYVRCFAPPRDSSVDDPREGWSEEHDS
ncbi:MAG: hypothetical protein Q8P82_03175 [bacterium]|nr:hypothetical protein [bacterium]